MALGQTDLGLYGVVGGLTMFVVFFNIQFATAIARFFAFSIGQAQRATNAESGLEECQRWFNVALCLHTVVPLVLVAIGYPIGAWAIAGGALVIPPERVDACLWVWRYCCLGCYISMINVPYQGMFTAKQRLVELSFYGIVQNIIRAACLYYMVTNPGDWLVGYAIMTMVVTILPLVIICIRAWVLFPECRFVPRYLWSPSRLRQVLSFVIWQVVGSAGYVARTSGVAVVVNNILGAKINASMSIANTLASETAVLTGALNSAFGPAITTACGAGDLENMRRMAFRSCKYGVVLTLIFALPLALEVDEVLRLWLKTPPEAASQLCLALLGFLVIEKATLGHTMAVNASGRVALYQTAHGFALATALLFSIGFLYIHRSVSSICAALIASIVVSSVFDVLIARRAVAMSVLTWIKQVILPSCVLSLVSLSIGLVPRFFMDQCFMRVAVTSAMCVGVFIPLVWVLILSADEKQVLLNKFRLRSNIV